jgi:hypothetical protein
MGIAMQGWKMWGVVPPDNGPVRKELVRVNDLIFSLDKPDFQLVGNSDNATADFIQSSLRGFVFD